MRDLCWQCSAEPPPPFGVAPQHTKITQFNAVLGVCGLAAVWRAASLPVVGGAAGLSIPSTTGDVLTIMAVVLLGLLSFM